ncbi:hypothetical protein SAMN04488601_101521 [Paenibacillus sp. 453mf]|nr:hypothetical protein SAMN04488601_101521 [Paenibacillus sp. 453mf]
MHTLCLTQLVKMIEDELVATHQTGMIIPDEGKDQEAELLLRTVKQASTSGRIFYDTFIKQSHCCNLIQLADICVFLTTIFHRDKYGSVRKNFNTELVQLYKDHLSPIATVWEYTIP